MSSTTDRLKQVALDLFRIDAVKFGDFMTKSGIRSPIYFDLRVIVSHPKVMSEVTSLLYDLGISAAECDHLCGVPYTALPIATLLSIKTNIPMLMRRKEAKAYGTKKMIEGQFKPNDKCLIIEDVVTSGSSILETVKDLKDEGLQVTEAIILLDREQGGKENLENHNVKVRSLFTLTSLLNILVDEKKITKSIDEAVRKYLKDTTAPVIKKTVIVDRTTLTYDERSELAKNPVSKKLFKLMATKKTNLCLSADLTSTTDILNLVEKVGQHICLLKTHMDIIEDFTQDFVNSLTSLAIKYNFVIMEDRKFADIGNTVALQYSKGLYKISSWADLVTAHSLPGDGVLKGLASVLDDKERGVFLLAEMSSNGNLITPAYTKASVDLAKGYESLIAGIVCQNKDVIQDPGMIQLTPGVQLESANDILGQVYNTPDVVIIEKGADIAVVGRGIIMSEKPEIQARLYREKLWNCYLQRYYIF